MIDMNITLNIEISNTKINNFQELEEEVHRTVLGLGRELLQKTLEQMDDEIQASRDKTRYRCKGFQKTCIKTVLGAVEFKRRVYVDAAAVETKHCVHLLDEDLQIEKVGLISSSVCQLAATAVTETTYRGASELVSKATGLHISHQAIWNTIQKLGESQSALVERHAELAQQHHGTGSLITNILYEEDDGIWLKLQGKSRQEYGASKEMKIGIAYDGVQWQETKSGKRKTLDNKVAYANFESSENFKRRKEGLVASRFDVDSIELRVHNGDGANWIRHKNDDHNIDVLDSFHRNKKITECVKDPEFATLLRSLLYRKDVPMLLSCIEAQINSLSDPAEIAKLEELQRYYEENKDSLLGYYDRNIPIPETRAPGEIHHACLGSMESNVFTLIGNRMKGRRACWSIDGANHLAILLCQRHTVGFENLFAALPEIPNAEPDFVDTLPIFGASKIPQREGHGYEYREQLQIANTSGYVKAFLYALSKTNNF